MVRDLLKVMGDEKLLTLSMRLLLKLFVRMNAATKLGMTWTEAASHFPRADVHLSMVRQEIARRGL